MRDTLGVKSREAPRCGMGIVFFGFARQSAFDFTVSEKEQSHGSLASYKVSFPRQVSRFRRAGKPCALFRVRNRDRSSDSMKQGLAESSIV